MDRAQGPRPSSASVQVRELSWHGRHNPHPQSKDPGSHGSGRSEHLVEEYLSPARLRALAQMPDLRLVSTLEMCVDTREYSLGNFGLHLPSLSQLKLNGSRLGSVRQAVQPSRALSTRPCPLQRPGHLPGPPAGAVADSLWPGGPGRHWLLPGPEGALRLLQLHLGPQPTVPAGAAGDVRPGGQRRGGPGAGVLPAAVPEAGHAHPGGQPGVPAARPPQQGAGPVLCGNPTKGLRERRHQCQAWEPTEQLPSQRLEGLATNACPPGPDPADSHDVLALAGLEAWRGLRLRQLESWQEGAKVPRGPRRGPEAQEDETGPKTSPSPLNLAPELSRTLGYHLLPSPPKLPMPPDSSSPWGSTDLQFRGRRLRALGDSGPGLDQGLAAVAALRSLEGASGPSPRNQGCPGPKPAPNPAAGRPALRCLPHLNPVTPAQSHP
ncbi:leucine-rich repeat-containing protein 56 isoform X3 [Rhinolophus ferrumequinum]|uniref:leucine-rich repeat-containing protein 56 isoform X3 n=1 Tax=Rhinolophus ferrumequinum TaxID=59479 RepID=UPI00140F9039|nr:leucine-rich repeat-containing protein 56 isoform X3 [Rhinolophus ferrumequinum]